MYEKLFGKKKGMAKEQEDEIIYTTKDMIAEENLSVFEDGA